MVTREQGHRGRGRGQGDGEGRGGGMEQRPREGSQQRRNEASIALHGAAARPTLPQPHRTRELQRADTTERKGGQMQGGGWGGGGGSSALLQASPVDSGASMAGAALAPAPIMEWDYPPGGGGPAGPLHGWGGHRAGGRSRAEGGRQGWWGEEAWGCVEQGNKAGS